MPSTFGNALRIDKRLIAHLTIVVSALVVSAVACAQSPSRIVEGGDSQHLENRTSAPFANSRADLAPHAGRAERTGGSSPPGGADALGAPNARSAAKSPAGKPSANSSQQLGKTDAGLMRELMQLTLTEIKMAALATAISRDAAVRAYATQMLNEYVEAKNRLQQIADSGGAILPHGVNTEQATLLHDLARLTGAEFNRTYLSLAGMQLHEQSRSLLQRVGAEAQNRRLKQYAALYEPMPQKHLDLAKNIMAQPAPSAAAAK